ncbi:hypothetical protein LTR08_003046 [Meristemomyces frigidus]|nr:hypothetical protein LTR08_003046 [Meristemomyces frigidus]
MAPKKTTGARGVAVVKKASKKVIRTDGWYAETVPELKKELKKRGALVGGKKDDLVARLDGLDAEGKTGEDSAAPVKATDTKKSGSASNKGTAATSTKGKGGKKPVPASGFRAGGRSRSNSPTVESALGKTASGRVIKVTGAHKKRAFGYQTRVEAILRKIEEDHGVEDENVDAVINSVFGPAYQSLQNAHTKLEIIRTDGDPIPEEEAEEGSEEDE